MSAASRRGFLKWIGSSAFAGYGPVRLTATNRSGSANPVRIDGGSSTNLFNCAPSGKATADSYLGPGFGPENAIDGSLDETAWVSTTSELSHWYCVELDKASEVERVTLYPGGKWGMFTLQVKEETGAWKSLASTDAWKVPGAVHFWVRRRVQAVRLHVSSSDNRSPVRLYEIEILAPADVVRQASSSQQFDVVVYGGTAGGVIAAVAAAREGASVVLLEPRRHLGGMVSGGLGRTDHGEKKTIGGYSLEFFRRVGRHYGKDIVWYFEPHVAETVFQEMVAESGVKVLYEQRLKEREGVQKEARRVVEIRMEDGSTFRGKVFIDSTYEGDLMAQAGVAYTWGREAVTEYNESEAGVYPPDKRFTQPERQRFDVKFSAFDKNGKLLPDIYSGPRGDLGSGDRKIQAYCFRLCLSNDPNNQTPYPKPLRYDRRRYIGLARMMKAFKERNGRPPVMKEIVNLGQLENPSKVDVNNNGHCIYSTDHINKSWKYPTAGYKLRTEIWEDHVSYTQGFFYFLAHDSEVPTSLKEEINRWGFCKDEFVDNNHWPHQLYIREARRMVGDFVMTQRDIQSELTKPDAIGMGSYASDSHNVQRFVEKDGTVAVEGNTFVPVTPYQIPYGVMLPKKQDVENLLVPVCVSSSHVAFSTLRMEPVYMIMGQAAGVAAKIAGDARKAVQDIDVATLQSKLREQGAISDRGR